MTTAVEGTTSASGWTYSSSATCTNWPGQSAPSAFSKLALRSRVPVAESTALSMNERVPVLKAKPPVGFACTTRALLR